MAVDMAVKMAVDMTVEMAVQRGEGPFSPSSCRYGKVQWWATPLVDRSTGRESGSVSEPVHQARASVYL